MIYLGKEPGTKAFRLYDMYVSRDAIIEES